jgi:hypothetical protein
MSENSALDTGGHLPQTRRVVFGPGRDQGGQRHGLRSLHVRTCTVLLLVIIGMMVTVSGWYMLSKLPLALNRDGIAIDGGSLQGAVHGTGGPYSFPH